MEILLNLIHFLIFGVKTLFTPPMTYYSLLGITGILITYKAKKA